MPGCFKLYSGTEGDLCFCAKDAFEKWSWMVVIERLMNYHTNLSTHGISAQKYITEYGLPSVKEYTGIEKQLGMEEVGGSTHEAVLMMGKILKQQEELKKERQ